MDEMGESPQQYVVKKKQQLDISVFLTVDFVIDHAIEPIERIVIYWFHNQLIKFSSYIQVIR